MHIILASLNGVILVMTLLPISRNESYWVRAFEFPRLQIGIMALGSLLIQALTFGYANLTSWAVAVGALVALGIQAWWVAPYTCLARCEVKEASQSRGDNSLKVLTVNVQQENDRYDDLLKIIEEVAPDVLVAMETNERWRKHLDVLADHGYDHVLRCPLENRYGMLLYSKLPLVDAVTKYLVEDDIPSMHVVIELRSGKTVRAHFIHPSPPSPTENEESSQRDAELVMVGKSARSSSIPVIVAGDLNDVAWSTTTRLFRKVSGLLDPRVGRGMLSSYHAKIPIMRWPLDQFFHSSGFSLHEIRRLRKFGSDHFPILIDLRLEEAPRSAEETLSADHDDLRLAQEKMDSENVDESAVPKT